jgi:S-methylmethionine-dependent homocysteine/selenocysteine methylase
MAGDYNQHKARAAQRSEALRERLAMGPTLLLDGATGTELEARGVDCRLPLWSAHALLSARDALLDVHRSHVAAGAEIVTANTFRTQRSVLASAGLADRAPRLCAEAVDLARASGASWVAGSVAPLRDCFQPELVPDSETLEREHADHCHNLARCGVDLLLVETHNCVREASIATSQARATGVPVITSFVCRDGAHTLAGEAITDALAAAIAAGANGVAVNCVPHRSASLAIPSLRACGVPFGVYPNVGIMGSDRDDALTPGDFAMAARSWLDAGAAFIGGCCGASPAHIRALACLLAERNAARSDSSDDRR